jgi:hypothetical protein
MATLIQICASYNDLFGLDSDGVVHQYNFNTNSWISIGRGRHEGKSPRLDNTSPFLRPNSHGGAPDDGRSPVDDPNA